MIGENMRKIAFINQRYGLEVNGGSEYYTRLIAEHLSGEFDVHILTTKAIDYMTWKDFYENDEENINGVTVHRFGVDFPRDQKRFDAVNAKLLQSTDHTPEDESLWVKEQGPVSTKLIEYIEENSEEYDVFIFVTYLYYTTSMGLPKVAEKSILIPTAHDEPYIYFNIFKEIFTMPKAIIFLTDEEKEFVHRLFQNRNIVHDTMAVGIDVPKSVNPNKFYAEKKIKDYFIYVGRIDEGKGCHWLFRFFQEYKKRNEGDVKLVLMGKSVIDIPEHPDIISLGFVSEEEKFDGIAGARALILPSRFESLSISALEALAVGTPVIMNGQCEVLKGHCIKSNAGLYYMSYFEFEGCLNYVLYNEECRNKMQENGKKYVDKYYRWEVILQQFRDIIEKVLIP